jgi:hypothetical protein
MTHHHLFMPQILLVLEVAATSLKVFVTSYINIFGDLRALYAIQNDPNEDPIYYPFPGFSNLDVNGLVINEAPE